MKKIQDNTIKEEEAAEKRVTFSDLLAARFHSGEQNFSEQVDQIVYRISREEGEFE